MRRLAATTMLMLMLVATLAIDAQAPPKQAAGEPKVTWYFYTVKWGFQDEFLDLFQRNHYPLLKARETRRANPPKGRGSSRATTESPQGGSGRLRRYRARNPRAGARAS